MPRAGLWMRRFLSSVPSTPSPLRRRLRCSPAPPSRTSTRRLIAKYTFENFVVGPSNRFAHAAAMAIAEQPGSHYNPLFIYGGAGLGKTHLLHAVGHHRRELLPGSIVRYVTSEQFFNEFIDGIRRKRMAEFKARYRTIDVLLLDDVQFFEGKEQILEEFFHTFNSLYEAGKQLVISSDRHPKHLSTLEDRLRSRFEWGLITDIQPPDVETRLAILRKNAEFAPPPVPDRRARVHRRQGRRQHPGARGRPDPGDRLRRPHPRDDHLEMAQDVLQDLVPGHEMRKPTAPELIMAESRRCATTSTVRTSRARAASSLSPGRARSPCTCAGNSPTSPSPRSAQRSAGAITPRSSTPSTR